MCDRVQGTGHNLFIITSIDVRRICFGDFLPCVLIFSLSFGELIILLAVSTSHNPLCERRMEDRGGLPKGLALLLASACVIVIVAGMRAASAIIVPFLLSIFIAVICSPPLFWMRRKGIPNTLAVIVTLIGVTIIGSLLVVLVGTSLTGFSSSLPFYQERLTVKTATLVSWLRGLGFEVSSEVLGEYFDPGRIMRMVANTLTGLRGLLTNVFLIVLTVLFILLEASGFYEKLQAALKKPKESIAGLNKFIEGLNRYLALKTLISIVTGLAIWLWLAIVGVDYPALWGLLAFLLNYVPNIGSIIAAVPAVLLALIQLGTSSALLTCLGYAAVNIIVGNLIEPRVMGARLGLSTLVVFLSLVFWGWVLGPVGMLLSIPLTMIVRIALMSL
jgi:predicted PurR-regulated permease PerM